MVTTTNSPAAEIRAFLRQPDDACHPDADRDTRFLHLFTALGMDAIAALLFIGLVALIDLAGIVDTDNHAVAEAFQQMTPVVILLVGGILVPLLEELVFRLPLRFRYNPAVGIARLATSDPERLAAIRAWWDRHYKWIFYGITAIFALVHMTNFEITAGVLITLPILVGAQFVMGALCGYLRVRFGVLWGFYLHALHNLILIAVSLPFMEAPPGTDTPVDEIAPAIEWTLGAYPGVEPTVYEAPHLRRR